MTSEKRRLILGMPPLGLALVIMIAIAALMSGVAIALLLNGRDQRPDGHARLATNDRECSPWIVF